MPYIKQEDREELDVGCIPKNAGELNYKIHLLLEEYIDMHGKNYQICNDIMGALQGVQQEFYRREVAPYEDEKIAENGDITFYKQYD